MIKRIIGGLILVVVFAFLVLMTFDLYGSMAFVAWGGALALIGLIALGIMLVSGYWE